MERKRLECAIALRAIAAGMGRPEIQTVIIQIVINASPAGKFETIDF